MKKWGIGIGLTLVICTGCFSAPQVQPSSTTAKTVEKVSESGNGGKVGTTKTAGKPQASATTGTAKQAAVQSVSSAVQPAQGSAGTGGTSVQAKSPEQIEKNYVGQLSQLEDYYQGQLEAMRNEAAAARQKGESKASIYNRYAGKASDLQEDSQAKVNALLFALKNELKAQHLPVDQVNTLRQSYYAKIDSAKSQLLQKLKE
jgi:hypothetical protein